MQNKCNICGNNVTNVQHHNKYNLRMNSPLLYRADLKRWDQLRNSSRNTFMPTGHLVYAEERIRC